MNNKRQNRYSFTSRKDLIAFFSDTLPKNVIKETIRNIKKTFTKRANDSWTSNKMQFLKKCEWELVRLYKKNFPELEKHTKNDIEGQ